MTCSVEPNQAEVEGKNPFVLQDNQLNWNKTAKQKHKEDLLYKKQQLMQSFSRNSKRHSAKRRENRFYEVLFSVMH